MPTNQLMKLMAFMSLLLMSMDSLWAQDGTPHYTIELDPTGSTIYRTKNAQGRMLEKVIVFYDSLGRDH